MSATYIYRAEYYGTITIGGCMNREDAVEHLRERGSTDEGYVPGDHHFTDDRLIIIPDALPGTIGREVWRLIQSLK
jgi:hypothetical protein